MRLHTLQVLTWKLHLLDNIAIHCHLWPRLHDYRVMHTNSPEFISWLKPPMIILSIWLDPRRPQGSLSSCLLNFTRGINSCNFAPVTRSKGVLYNMWNWYSQWKIACKFLMAVQWLFGGLISSGIKWGNLKLLLCHLIRLLAMRRVCLCVSPPSCAGS